MKKICRATASVLFLFLLLSALSGCKKTSDHLYSVTVTDCFDTVCSLYASAENEDRFFEMRDLFLSELRTLDGLFDAYGDHTESNLKTVNDNAGKSPVAVDRRLLDLMLFSKEAYAQTDGTVNPMMGAVTVLWKEATALSRPPKKEDLEKAGAHTDISLLEIDEEKETLFVSDENARIDVGALAKGYAAKLLCGLLEKEGCTDFLISLGGNLCARGVDPTTGKPFTAGIQNPQTTAAAAVYTLSLSDAALVTSGSYERYFDFEGKRYHHIIDPQTLAPSKRCGTVSVSVYHSDPALADLLSTALFILPVNEGTKLLEKIGGSALWIDENGEMTFSDGFPEEAKRTDAEDLAVLICLAAALTLFALLFFRYRKREVTQESAEETAAKPVGYTFSFKRRDALFFAALVLFLSVFPFIPRIFAGNGTDRPTAVVTVDGEEVCRLPLFEDVNYTVKTEYGMNVVTVKDRKVFISDADCRNRDCTRCAALDGETVGVIACLPHRLTVTVKNDKEEA